MQYPSPLCRLKWAVKHVIGLHVKLTILKEFDVALTTILGMLISNIVLRVDTRAHATGHSLVGLKRTIVLVSHVKWDCRHHADNTMTLKNAHQVSR